MYRGWEHITRTDGLRRRLKQGVISIGRPCRADGVGVVDTHTLHIFTSRYFAIRIAMPWPRSVFPL